MFNKIKQILLKWSTLLQYLKPTINGHLWPLCHVSLFSPFYAALFLNVFIFIKCGLEKHHKDRERLWIRKWHLRYFYILCLDSIRKPKTERPEFNWLGHLQKPKTQIRSSARSNTHPHPSSILAIETTPSLWETI